MFGNQVFEAILRRVATNLPNVLNVVVQVPAEVSQAFDGSGPIAVEGWIDDQPFDGTLMPIGAGRHCLHISHVVRARTGKRPGESVRIEIHPDLTERMLPVDLDLVEALREADAWLDWQGMNPSRRKECLRWLRDAGEGELRQYWLDRVVATVVAERRRARADET